MTCDQTQPLLEAFADGELGWGTAWCVRRHLAACPACTAELAEARRLDSRVRAWRDVPAPSGLQSRITAALPSVAAPRRPVTVRRVAVGLAGVAAASAAFFWLAPGQPGRPTIAFADVEQAMEQAQTVSYDFDSHLYDPQGRVVPNVNAMSSRIWLRRRPAANADYNAIMHEWNLYDARGYVGYSQTCNNYLEKPPEGDITQSVEKQLRRLTEPPTEAVPEELRSAPDFHFQSWQRQETTMNGQDCLMFTQDEDRAVRTEKGGRAHELTRTTIWVDAQTLHIIRIELVGDPTQNIRPKESGFVERSVIDNFHYDETPPPGVFDWSPPPGANVRGHW